MPILFRHADPRFAFLWEDGTQPAARWHGSGEGPAHYFADTPDGAWADFLRHEEITDPADLTGVTRALWAVDVPHEPGSAPGLPTRVLLGGLESYARCQAEARRLRAAGATRLHAPSAALLPGAAAGHRVDEGLRVGPARDGRVVVLFGRRADLIGWQIVTDGRPPEALLARVRHFR